MKGSGRGEDAAEERRAGQVKKDGGKRRRRVDGGKEGKGGVQAVDRTTLASDGRGHKN